jgi:cytochrome P450
MPCGEADLMAPSAQSGQPPVTLLSVEDTDPFGFYESLRARGPLVWDEVMQGWLVLSYEHCRLIETQEGRFRHPYSDASPELVEIKGGRSNLTLLQGEEHARMRRFHLKLLTPRAVESYRTQYVKPIIDFLLDRVVAKGRADLTTDFGDQVPPRVIAALFGMPWEDDAMITRILHLHEEVMAWIGRRNSGEEFTRRARAAADEINAMLLPYIRARREQPQDDFVSRVWLDAPAEYGEMTEADALSICREIFLGGSDTTVHGIANSLYLLLSNAAAYRAVEQDRDAARTNLVEEAMRLYGSVQYRFRVANEDCELGGVPVKKDQILILLHAAAHRDPAHYACPAAMDLTRRPITDHLAFNVGPRACIGSNLARVEMRDSIAAVLDRLPNVQLDPDAEPPRFRSLFMRSFRPLHVVFG